MSTVQPIQPCFTCRMFPNKPVRNWNALFWMSFVEMKTATCMIIGKTRPKISSIHVTDRSSMQVTKSHDFWTNQGRLLRHAHAATFRERYYYKKANGGNVRNHEMQITFFSVIFYLFFSSKIWYFFITQCIMFHNYHLKGKDYYMFKFIFIEFFLSS